jgi:hypothetical protein
MALMTVTLVSVAVCDVCSTTAAHSSNPETGTAREALTKAGWWFSGLKDALVNALGDPVTALCHNCSAALVPALPATG